MEHIVYVDSYFELKTFYTHNKKKIDFDPRARTDIFFQKYDAIYFSCHFYKSYMCHN